MGGAVVSDLPSCLSYESSAGFHDDLESEPKPWLYLCCCCWAMGPNHCWIVWLLIAVICVVAAGSFLMGWLLMANNGGSTNEVGMTGAPMAGGMVGGPSAAPSTPFMGSITDGTYVGLTTRFQPLQISGLCLEIPGLPMGMATNGVIVSVGECNDGPNQLWRFTTAGNIVPFVNFNIEETLCLSSIKPTIGSELELFRCQNDFILQKFIPSLDNQRIQLAVSDTRTGMDDNLCVGVRETIGLNNSTASQSNTTSSIVQTQQCLDGMGPGDLTDQQEQQNQEWSFERFVPSTAPSFSSTPTLSPTTAQSITRLLQIDGLCIKAPALILVEGDDVVLMECNGQPDEMWRVGRDGTIQNTRDLAFCMTIKGTSEAMDRDELPPIVLEPCHKDPNERQQFSIDGQSRLRSSINEGTSCVTPRDLMLPINGVEKRLVAAPCGPTAMQTIDVVPVVLPPGSDGMTSPTATPNSLPQLPTFTTAPVAITDKPATRKVELSFVFDLSPDEIAWRLLGPCGTVAEVSPGHYSTYLRQEHVAEEFRLLAGNEYALDLTDVGGDGLNDPFGRVYLLIEHLDGTQEFVFHEWGNFGRTLYREFIIPGDRVDPNC